MKTKNLLCIVVIGIATFSGCKKYEEGPGFTLKTAKGRITNQWVYKNTLFGGKAPNSPYDTYGLCYYLGDNIDIKKDESFVATKYCGNESGKWSFSSDKNSITFTENGSSDAMTYTILKLTGKELWINYPSQGSGDWTFQYEKQ